MLPQLVRLIQARKVFTGDLSLHQRELRYGGQTDGWLDRWIGMVYVHLSVYEDFGGT